MLPSVIRARTSPVKATFSLSTKKLKRAFDLLNYVAISLLHTRRIGFPLLSQVTHGLALQPSEVPEKPRYHYRYLCCYCALAATHATLRIQSQLASCSETHIIALFKFLEGYRHTYIVVMDLVHCRTTSSTRLIKFFALVPPVLVYALTSRDSRAKITSLFNVGASKRTLISCLHHSTEL